MRDFLQLRGDDAVRQAAGRNERSLRRDGDDRQPSIARQGDAIRRGEETQRNLRDGRDIGDRVTGDRNFGDREGNQRDMGDRVTGDRNFGDRGDRNYQKWRDNAWRGERGEGRDQRDWSGKWREGERFATANNIRDHWRHDRDRDDFPFHDNWWSHHDDRHHHWGFWGDFAFHHHRPYYWWGFTSAPGLASWIAFGWPTYYYWDYGPGEYIYCDDGVVYVNGRWYAPAPVFYERTVRLVDQAPDLTPEEAAQLEWLPLGVFAVTRDGVAEGDVLVQLAVTRDGVIGGTAYNQQSRASYPIEGIVEKETQRAVWSYADAKGTRIVMETSIYNLTQPEATGLVHYGPNDIRVIELVRLEQPGDGSSEAVSAPQGELPPPGVPR